MLTLVHVRAQITTTSTITAPRLEEKSFALTIIHLCIEDIRLDAPKDLFRQKGPFVGSIHLRINVSVREDC